MIVFSHEGDLSLDDKDFGYGTNEHGSSAYSPIPVWCLMLQAACLSAWAM